MRPRLVVAGVATGTIWLERRELPSYDLGVALMAFGAREIIAVVLRLIRKPGMAVVGRRPRIRVVARAAILRGIEVSGILARCGRAIVAG